MPARGCLAQNGCKARFASVAPRAQRTGNPMGRNLVTAFVSAALALAAASCVAGVSLRPVVPERLDVAADQPLALQARASGFQIYRCAASADASRFDWTLKAPQAELFDSAGRRIGSHYAGPTWEADDGSMVIASVRARVDAPDGGAIPWLLLAATSNTG